MKKFTLPKTERLYLRESISDLFANGKSFTAFPYRVVYKIGTSGTSSTENILPEFPNEKQARCAIMAIAPKKRFKHAVDRNHIKRLTREAYRLQKLPLIAALQDHDSSMEIAFLYVDNKFVSFEETHRVIGKAISRLIKAIQNEHHQ